MFTHLIKQHSTSSESQPGTTSQLAELRARWRSQRAFATGLTLARCGLALATIASALDMFFALKWTTISDAVLLGGCVATLIWSRERLVWWPLYFSYWLNSNITIFETGGIQSPVGGLFFAVLFISGICVQARFSAIWVFLFTSLNVLVWGVSSIFWSADVSPTPAVFTSLINLISLIAIGICAFGYLRAEAQLEDDYTREEAANAAKTTFLANVSHELRTPLGAITGFAELIQDPGSTDVERFQYSETIRRNGEQLTKLVDNLLDLSKIEAGHMEIEDLEFDPAEAVGDVVQLLRFKAEQKGLVLSFSIQDDVPDAVLADPMRFKQILMNLVGNSIKFTQVGSVSIDVRYDERAPGTGNLIVEVRDTGSGLTEAERERLFQPYVQADPSVSRRFGGTGLGLSLSKKLSELLGGDLCVLSSEPNVGSVFCFYIFVRALKARKVILPDVVKKPAPRASDSRLKGKCILVVDDSSDNRQLIQKYLENSEADVRSAASGRAALELTKKQNFDLILMDIQMPEMDGLECAQALRQCEYTKPIVALTAHAMHEDRDRCLEAGFDDFMTKPISRSELVGKLALLVSPV